MRVIPNRDRKFLPLCKSQRLFIEAWYSMVNRESLDSYRAKCMGTISILEELILLLESKVDPNSKKPYIEYSILEAFKIIKADRVIATHFDNEKKILFGQLEEVKSSKDYKLCSYFVRDYLGRLQNENSYCFHLIDGLENSIFNTKADQEIVDYTSSLLSYLINYGYSLESLNALIEGIFIKNNSLPKPSFKDSFAFLKRTIARPTSDYKIIFRLIGSSKRGKIPERIGNIIINENSDIDCEDKNVKKLLTPNVQHLFAEVTVNACDDRGAGLLAKQQLNTALDLLRFEFEEEVVSIHNKFVSIRNDFLTVKGKYRVFGMPDLIPNPKTTLGSHQITEFIDKVEAILNRDDFLEDGKSKIRAALRFIRTGRDAEVLENKFLNWWTALEYLTVRPETSPKILDVEKYLAAISVVEYLEKHLHHIRKALDYSGTSPSETVKEKYQIQRFSELKSGDFFDVLRDENETQNLIASLDTYEMLKYRLSKLSDVIIKNGIRDFLISHENNVKWQIQRIYRIRNAIVHNADHTLNLSLIAANLEYYLRRIFLFLINTIHQLDKCKDLSEIYDRVHYTSDRIKKKASDIDVIKNLLSQKIY